MVQSVGFEPTLFVVSEVNFMAVEDRIHAVVDPIIEGLDLELVDLVYGGGRLRITIDHAEGLDTELLTKATRMISHEMDLADPVSGTYTLEVSSPGIERPLRTPAHYLRSIGEQVSVKLKASGDASPGTKPRRVKGELTAADEDSVTISADDGDHVISYEQIAKAKTVFDWSPAPKPGKANKTNPRGRQTATPKG
jgi:ribosome maturation factor RimP